MKNNIFGSIKIRRPGRNMFDLTHAKKISCKMGQLVPIMLEEVVPGDKFMNQSEIMMRLAPMLAPVMHPINVWTHFFFVPTRLLWDEFQDFITGGEDGDLAPVAPYVSFSHALGFVGKGSLSDYLGLPPGSGGAVNAVQVSALPFRAYQLIYNEYYRDQNLQNAVAFDKGSGAAPDFSTIGQLQYRCWEKDYFTSCLPWAQRGGDVTMPFEPQYKNISEVIAGSGDPLQASSTLRTGAAGATSTVQSALDAEGVRIENLDDGAGVTINDLRLAVRIQEWLEKNARGGARYIEQILSHFGVKSSDARLQRPEYLGGGVQPVVISEVLQTVGTDAAYSGVDAPLGTMGGHGLSVGGTNKFKRSFEEHGYIIGIMSVLPRTAYQQGIERLWTRSDKFDYYWPEFASLGEQEVKIKELYYTPTGADAHDQLFGYQQRYAEYKYRPSTVHGEFRDTLDYWHMGRKFTNYPALNSTFVTADPTKRIFAVQGAAVEDLYVQVLNKTKALRPMPYHSVPAL